MKALVLLVACLFCGLSSADAASRNKKQTLEEVGREVYVWGYPAVVMKRAREAMLSQVTTTESLNHFIHSSKVPDPFLGSFFPVNPENLYSWAWADVSPEPLVMIHPQVTDRYYSVQLIDAYGNVFHTISNKNHGDKAGTFAITSSGWNGVLPANTVQIRASTPEIFILVQTFVKDDKEAARLSKTSQQRTLIPLSQWTQGASFKTTVIASPETSVQWNRNLAVSGFGFLRELQSLLHKNPPFLHPEENLLEKLKETQGALTEESRKALERGLFEGEREIQNRLAAGTGTKINGWDYEMKAPAFSEDHLLRAAAAQKSLFSPPAEETLQMTLEADSESRQLFSGYRYTLHFEKEDLPPARDMWSLQAQDADKKSVSVLNDRKAHLKINMDGSVDILVQQEKPAPSLQSNWLPLPKNSNFSVTLTMFNPGTSVLNRKYIAPSLARVDEDSLPKRKVTRTMMADARVSK